MSKIIRTGKPDEKPPRPKTNIERFTRVDQSKKRSDLFPPKDKLVRECGKREDIIPPKPKK